jgi:hypothetical protein
MKGSTKQVTWAFKIRMQKLPALMKLLDYQNDSGKLQARVREIAQAAIDNDDASFWIAHRQSPLTTLLKAQEFRLIGQEPPDREIVAKAEAEAEAILKSSERPSFVHPDEWQYTPPAPGLFPRY